MSITSFYALFCFSLFFSLSTQTPYLSPTTIQNYEKMIRHFKIFIYKPNKAFNFSTPAESLFYTSLQRSSFVTQNADEAHLFFVPFSPDISRGSLGRFIASLRREFPYWDRSLGADHFFLSCAGIGESSDRNLVELKKNSVQISCFPMRNTNFIPHKDITLPPISGRHLQHHAPAEGTEEASGAATILAYVLQGSVKSLRLVNELSNETAFLVESQPSDLNTFAERLASSKFCMFEYGSDMSWIGEALRFGCVPAVIVDGPINDLPFMGVLRWQDIAVFVRGGGGVEDLRHVLDRAWRRERHEEMRRLGVVASRHFVWNQSPEPFDSFNTVMYQLWLRRHAIRYVMAE